MEALIYRLNATGTGESPTNAKGINLVYDFGKAGYLVEPSLWQIQVKDTLKHKLKLYVTHLEATGHAQAECQ